MSIHTIYSPCFALLTKSAAIALFALVFLIVGLINKQRRWWIKQEMCLGIEGMHCGSQYTCDWGFQMRRGWWGEGPVKVSLRCCAEVVWLARGQGAQDALFLVLLMAGCAVVSHHHSGIPLLTARMVFLPVMMADVVRGRPTTESVD